MRTTTMIVNSPFYLNLRSLGKSAVVRSSKHTLIALAIASLGLLAGPASATIVGLNNADFEDAFTNKNDVPGWFDFASGGGDLIQDDADTNPVTPAPPSGSNWLNLVDRDTFSDTAGVYQSFGTHDAGITSYGVSFTIGQRSTANAFDDIVVEIYSGTGTGADGTAISGVTGLTLLSGQNVARPGTWVTGTAYTAPVTLSFDASGLADGDTLWLSFRVDGDKPETGTQSLVDDVSVTAIIPEPATLLIWSLLAGLGVGLGWRRRKR